MFNGFFQEAFNNSSSNFNNFFQILEQMGNNYGSAYDDQPQQRKDNKPPPASKRAIDTLPVVQITADDLMEETNKECLICLESHVIGMMSCKLPCGHLFHKPCLTEWLVKQCTCPVCRYELETEDREFEANRKHRMKDRKLRFRKDELKNMTIHQLKEICAKLSLTTIDCIDKQEIVDKIIRSGKVIVTDGIPPIEMSEEDFYAKNVSELKHLLLAFGLSSEGALEKSDLRSRLLESGRVVLTADMDVVDESKPVKSSGNDNNRNNNNNNNISDQLKGGGIASNSNNNNSNYMSYSREELRNMSLSGLRELCRRYHIDTSTCLDKSEVIDAMIRARNFPVRPDSKIESNGNSNSNSVKESADLIFQSSPPSSSQPPLTRSRNNSQHRSSPPSSTYIRSRSNSYDPESRKRSLSNSSNNSHNEPTVIMPPYPHTINLQEPNYDQQSSNNSDFYHTEPIDQAMNYLNHFLHSAATEFSTMYQQAQAGVRSRSNSSTTATPPSQNNGNNPLLQQTPPHSVSSNNSTTSTPPRAQSSEGGGREKLVLSRDLIESLNISEIRMILESYGVNVQDCVDREDHLNAMGDCPFVEIVD